MTSGRTKRLFIAALSLSFLFSSSGVALADAPTISGAGVFTLANSAPRVDGASGAFTQHISLDIPPGRNGLQPTLSLDYNSQNTEQDSLVGYGWSLSIPYIARMNKTGTQDMYSANAYFMSSLDGELGTTTTATTTAPTYRARVDDGSFRQYTYATSTNSWVMYDKNGTQYLFGSSTQSQQSATSSPSAVHKWMLEKVIDTNGNYIRYTYNKDNNQIYPYQIIYTGSGSTDGPAVVTFATSTRGDMVTSYKSGFRVTTNYRISSITAAFNGSNVRQYALSYTTGNNGSRSLLSAVQQTGWDDGGSSTTLPATTFGYISSTTPFVGPGGQSSRGPGYIIGDINGDGVNDTTSFLKVQTDGSLHESIFLAGGSTESSYGTPPDYWANNDNCVTCFDSLHADDHGVRFLDVNGDGKADVVSTSTIYANNYSSGTYGWSSTSSFNGVIPSFQTTGKTGGQFADVNGTGLPSFVQRVDGYVSSSTYIGNGSAWNAATTTTFKPPMSFPDTSSPSATSIQLVDINGDGLSDWVYSDASSTKVLLNTGTGWESTSDSTWTIATSSLYQSTSGGTTLYYDRGIRFLDVNGDGLADMVHSYAPPSGTMLNQTAPLPEKQSFGEVSLNTGHGWAATTSLAAANAITNTYYSDGTNYVWRASNFYFDEFSNWIGNGQMAQDVLSTVANPKGGSTSVTYGYTTQSAANTQLPYNLLVVTRVVNSDGRGTNEQTDYTYAGGLQYLPTNVFDRKFAGFASTTETHADKTIVTYYNQGNSVDATSSEQTDGYGQINHAFRKDIFSTLGTLVQKILYRWDTYAHGNSTFVALGQQQTMDYASNGTHQDSVVDYTYSTTTDDLLTQYEHGDAGAGNDRTTQYTYAASSTINLSALIQKTVATSSTGTTTDQQYVYDNLPFGSVGLGNQTKELAWVSGTHYASSTKTYNSYGLVTQSTDRKGNATTYTYDAYTLYPATSTNALAQSTQYTYNYSNGKVKQTTDPNGAVTSNTYDGVGRLTQVSQSDISSPASLVTKSLLQYTDSTTTPSLVRRTDYLTSATTTDSYAYYDGLSRLIQERKSSGTSGIFTVSDSVYNTAGLLSSQSLPYFSSGSSLTTATTTNSLYTTYTYDPLGRKTTIVTSVGTTTNVYAAWKTTTTDPNGNVKDYLHDAYNNLTQVVEHHVAGNATTTYTYDKANNLTKITDALSNIRNFTYDGIGRRLAAGDLHAPSDTSYGTTTYSYDDQGNKTSQVDAKSQTVNYTYDALNRALTEDYTGAAGTEVTYTYDSCTYGVGRMCSASSTSAYVANKYNVLGLVSYATTTVNGTGYTMGYTYDRQGNIVTATYPNGLVVSNGYNLAGQLQTLQAQPGGGSISSIVSSTQYAPTGAASYRLFGNSVPSTLTYDANSLYRLTNIFTGTTTTATSSNTYSLGLTRSSTQYAYHTDASAFDLTGDLTIEVWAKFTTIPSSNGDEWTIASKYDFDNSGRAYSFEYLKEGGTLSFRFVNSGNGSSADLSCKVNYTLSSGTWYHLAVTKSSATVTVYVNGSSVGTCTAANSTIANTNAKFAVGAVVGNTAENRFDGLIDDVRVWNVARTSGQISANNNAELTGTESGLMAYYKLNNSYTDGTSGSNTLTAVNTPTFNTDVPNFAGPTVNTALQNISYTYDANGNITAISDTSTTTAARVMAYTYDDLNRLTNAITSSAATSTYHESYSYDVLGDLTQKATSTPTSGGTNTYSLSLSRASGQYGYHNDASSFDVTGDLTIEAWAKFASLPASNGDEWTIASKYDFDNSGRAYSFEYLKEGGVLSFRFVNSSNGSSADLSCKVNYSSFSTGTWYHLAVTKSGTTVTVYVNGSSVGTCTAANSSLANTNAKFAIGAVVGNTAESRFDGLLDEVRLWNTARTSGQISGNKDTELAGTESGLAAYYTLDNVYTDLTGNTDGITLVNSASFSTSTPFSGSSSGNGGTYIYAYAGTNYANPHAATSVGSTTLTYDNNGNLVAYGANTYGWDYRNRLASSTIGGVVATYGYDYADSRVYQSSNNATTTYPNKWYSIVSSGTNATSTSYIWAGDTLVAYIDQPLVNGVATGTAQTYFVHPDHLGSTNVTTNVSGTVQSVKDYYPFGQTRIQTGTQTSRSYIGEFQDSDSMSYLNARYYQSDRGQFMSEDPVFLAVGAPDQIKRLTSKDQQTFLMDPQAANSYSYAQDNPITQKDPSGNFIQILAIPAIESILGLIELGFYGKAAIDTTNSAYNNFVLPSQYPGAFGQTYKNDAPTRFLADATLNWGSNAIPTQAGGILADSLLWTGEYIPYSEKSKINASKSPSPFSPYSDLRTSSGTSGASYLSSGSTFKGSGTYNLSYGQAQSVEGVLRAASQTSGVNLQSVRSALDSFINASVSKKK